MTKAEAANLFWEMQKKLPKNGIGNAPTKSSAERDVAARMAALANYAFGTGPEPDEDGSLKNGTGNS